MSAGSDDGHTPPTGEREAGGAARGCDGRRGPCVSGGFALLPASRGGRIAAALILGGSVAARLVLVLSAEPALVSDARDYHVYAYNLANFGRYEQTYEGETEAFRGFTFHAYRPPGYPAFLAVLYSICGWRPEAALTANVLFDVLTQVCWLAIATRLFGTAAGLVAQGLIASHVLWTPTLLTEPLFAALFSIAAMLLIVGSPLKRARNALALGIVIAAAIFVRPIGVCLFVPLVTGVGARSKRVAALTACLLTVFLPTAAGLTAWGWRNHGLFGEWVWTTTNLGDHNADEFGLGRERTFAELRGAGLNEAQINREFLRREWASLRGDPWGWIELVGRRVGDLFSLEPAYEVRTTWEGAFRAANGDESPLGRMYRWSYGQYYVAYPLAALGAVIALLRRECPPAFWALLAAYVGIHGTLSRGDIRLVAPVYPAMCVLASVALAWVGAIIRRANANSPASTGGAA